MVWLFFPVTFLNFSLRALLVMRTSQWPSSCTTFRFIIHILSSDVGVRLAILVLHILYPTVQCLPTSTSDILIPRLCCIKRWLIRRNRERTTLKQRKKKNHLSIWCTFLCHIPLRPPDSSYKRRFNFKHLLCIQWVIGMLQFFFS